MLTEKQISALRMAMQERNRLMAEADKLRAERNKLWAEADKLRAKADRLWTDAVLKHVGSNVELDWKNFSACWVDGVKFE